MITIERLKEVLSYDPWSGEFTWKDIAPLLQEHEAVPHAQPPRRFCAEGRIDACRQQAPGLASCLAELVVVQATMAFFIAPENSPSLRLGLTLRSTGRKWFPRESPIR